MVPRKTSIVVQQYNSTRGYTDLRAPRDEPKHAHLKGHIAGICSGQYTYMYAFSRWLLLIVYYRWNKPF